MTRVITVLALILMLHSSVLGQSSDSGTCDADAKWLNTSAEMNYSRAAQTPTSLSLLAHLSGGRSCANAEVTLTATYLTDALEFICSGTVRQAMVMGSEVQTFNLEIRPFSQLDFMRWRNQPGRSGIQQGKRLVCFNLDGTTDVGDNDRQKAGWIRLSAGVLPRSGGLGVVEVMIRVSP